MRVGLTAVFRRYSVGVFCLAAALPQAAAACAQLSANVWLCDRDTVWETAQWDPYGDGTTLLLGDVYFNFTEEWPGFEIGDDIATLDEQYATYAEWVATDGGGPIEVLQVDTVNAPIARTLRHLQRDQFEQEPETMSAVMLAEVGTARIMLYLDAPLGTSLVEIDTMSRDLVALLRDTCADPISCAPDYTRPEAEIESN